MLDDRVYYVVLAVIIACYTGAAVLVWEGLKLVVKQFSGCH